MKPKKSVHGKAILSDKIADILTVKPRADIEDDHIFDTKPKTISRVDFNSSESEDEVAISDFRKRNVNLLSELSKKYEGEVVSKREVDQTSEASGSESSEDESQRAPTHSSQRSSENSETEQTTVTTKAEVSYSDDSDSGDESDDYSITQLQKAKSSKNNSDDSVEGDDDDEGDDDEGDGYDISQMDEPMPENFEHMKKQNLSEESKNEGISVRSQLLLWESLLEMRIHLQRCMNTANQMPLRDTFQSMKNSNNEEFISECNVAKSNITNVLDKMLTLQNTLLRNFPETKHIATGKKLDTKVKEAKVESDEEIPSDTEDEEIPSDSGTDDKVVGRKQQADQNDKLSQRKKRKLEDYENEISTSHKAIKVFRDATIQTWNEKTRMASTANLKNAPTNTILQQISFILSDRNKLIKRTQLKRSEYDIVGHKQDTVDTQISGQNGDEINPTTKDRKDTDEYITEIFDDSDFYHQLLRELIECKSADISDPVQLSRQWIALQQMRSKMKRKVDTKATKGRRIKYVVHNQLVNFMAPEKNITWSDESKTELYNSLFGKMFENNNGFSMIGES